MQEEPTKAKNESPKNDDETAKIAKERQINAKPGFFLGSAIWLLSRFPLTKNKYQNWTSGRRILIGWLLWLVCLPIIPIVAIIIWYVKDPAGFKKSPWAKALIGLAIAWTGAFGLVATEPAQLDQNGKYSPFQTEANGENTTDTSKPEAIASDSAKRKILNQTESKETNGREFANCTEAFEAGVFNIKRSNSSYSNKLDRDNDGIACEK